MACGARAQVRSFAKENASCKRYGVAQQQVLGWGLKSAHASGAPLARCVLQCAWLRWNASAVCCMWARPIRPHKRCIGAIICIAVPALRCCKTIRALCDICSLRCVVRRVLLRLQLPGGDGVHRHRALVWRAAGAIECLAQNTSNLSAWGSTCSLRARQCGEGAHKVLHQAREVACESAERHVLGRRNAYHTCRACWPLWRRWCMSAPQACGSSQSSEAGEACTRPKECISCLQSVLAAVGAGGGRIPHGGRPEHVHHLRAVCGRQRGRAGRRHLQPHPGESLLEEFGFRFFRAASGCSSSVRCMWVATWARWPASSPTSSRQAPQTRFSMGFKVSVQGLMLKHLRAVCGRQCGRSRRHHLQPRPG